MRKTILGGIAVTTSLGMVLASGALAGGNGAQRSGLSANSGSSTSNCESSDGSGGNGFVILNAPGQPGGPGNKLVGEVSLKNGAPNTTYMVNVSVGNQNCMPEGTLTTNGVGNGNAHIADPTLGTGTFYVVLTVGNSEAFASGPVTVK